jgi:hypothetical protein
MSIEPKVERFLQHTMGDRFCADCLAARAGLLGTDHDTLAGRLKGLMRRSRVAALIAGTFRHFTDRVVADDACDQCGAAALVVRMLPPRRRPVVSADASVPAAGPRAGARRSSSRP